MEKLTLTTDGERGVIVKRLFAAPAEALYRAHTEAGLIKQWLLGPDGWTMPLCICEAKSGGKILYEWHNINGGSCGLTGELLELNPWRRIVHVERMHLPQGTPDNHIETTFDPDGAGTLLTMRMTLPDSATRAQMLASGMEDGMESSYVRLQRLI